MYSIIQELASIIWIQSTYQWTAFFEINHQSLCKCYKTLDYLPQWDPTAQRHSVLIKKSFRTSPCRNFIQMLLIYTQFWLVQAKKWTICIAPIGTCNFLRFKTRPSPQTSEKCRKSPLHDFCKHKGLAKITTVQWYSCFY